MKKTPRNLSHHVAGSVAAALMVLSGWGLNAAQNPPGCSANNLNVNIGVRANNITNGTVVTWFVTVQNPAVPTSCDVTLGPEGLFFICPGPDGNATGPRTILIPGGTTLAPGFGLETFEIPCTVQVTPGVRTAEGKVSAPGSVVHKNPLQDDPANVDKSISVNLFYPCLNLTSQCISAVNPNGTSVTVTYSGTLSNCGDVFLENVVVFSDKPSPNTMVFGPITLPARGVTNFTASYTTENLCGPYVTALNASGLAPLDVPVLVTSAASSQCSISYQPAILVTKLCPTAPVQPGQTLVISGVVSNAGNIALTNVTVVNSLPAPNTLLLGPITLSVGQVAAYTGTYNVPADSCPPYVDIVTANGTALCSGQLVTSAATASCPGTNSPAIQVTQNCPAAPVAPGGTLTYTGTVTNTGNITLINVVVVSDKPAPNTRIFGPATLAPGAGAVFTANYNVPVDSCGPYTHTVIATGLDKCFNAMVSSSSTGVCPGTSTPAIRVTRTCPTSPVQPGGTLNFTGTVSNPGDIALTNVTVMNGSTLVYGPATLAAKASANFTGNYTVPADSCGPYIDAVVAQGLSACGTPVQDSITVACPGTNSPAIRVTRDCPTQAVQPGGLLAYTGTVTNTGNITLTNVTVMNTQPSPAVVFGPATLAPGAGATFNVSYNVPLDSCGPYADTLTASGADKCYGQVVSHSASSSCAGATTPGIAITQDCPATPASMGDQLTFTGTIINLGNITLTNIVVVNDRPSANTTVFRAASLAPGQSTNFVGSFPVPANLNACTIVNTLKVTANNKCGGPQATNSVTTSCTVISAPLIRVTKTCPTTPVQAGAVLTYSGSVSNAGNVTLTNVMVYNDYPTLTPIFATNTLVPRASARFTGSYTTPQDACSVSDIVSASATDLCNNLVRHSVQTTCPLATTAGIALTTSCPDGATKPGETLTFSGWVTNTGNVTLSNVTVVVDRPAADTLFFGPVTLVPQQAAGFFGSFVVPTNVNSCTVSYNLVARGQNKCTGTTVSANQSATCPVVTTPRIVVIKSCPPNPVAQGAVLTFTGTVINEGDVTLRDIVVMNNVHNLATNVVVFRAASLLPGRATNFTGSYIVPTDCCSITDTLQARGTDNCTGNSVTNTSTAICPVLFTPLIRITRTCATPEDPVLPGGTMVYSGTVSNAGNITLTDITVFNSINGENQPVLGLAALAPGEWAPYVSSYIVPNDSCGTDTVTVRALSLCGETNATDSATATCPLKTTPGIALSRSCPPLPIRKGETVTFTAMVLNTGNVMLTNVTVVNSLPVRDTLVFGPVALAAGQATNFTFSYTAPLDCNCCDLVDTLTARGRDRCSGSNVVVTATSVCPYQRNPRVLVAVDCPTPGGSPGTSVAFGGTVMNLGDGTLTNVTVDASGPLASVRVFGPVTLAPGEAREFFSSYTVTAGGPPASTLKLTATGSDPCNGLFVTSEDNCGGTVPIAQPVIMPPTVLAGNLHIAWSAVAGVTYRLQSAANYVGAAWQDEPGDIIAQTTTAEKTIALPADKCRLYRVMVVP